MKGTPNILALLCEILNPPRLKTVSKKKVSTAFNTK
jgi:hypothetical protein